MDAAGDAEDDVPRSHPVFDLRRTELTEEEVQARLEIMQSIAGLAVSNGEPDHDGRDHDKILYSGPNGVR